MRSPTPHSAPTGRVRRNGTVAAAGTSSMPSGLACVDASFATNFVVAIPTEHVIPWSAWTRRRSAAAIRVGGPRRRRAPLTSRNASSTLTCSTSAVISPSATMTERETSWYRAWSGGTTTACGHSRRAVVMGIAEWTPNARAS